MLPCSGDIRDQILKWSKIDRNFVCFWPPNFFGGEFPEFLKSIYKIQAGSYHVAKFQGDRSRDLGESVAKKRKKETSAVKHKPVRNDGSGRPKKHPESARKPAPLGRHLELCRKAYLVPKSIGVGAQSTLGARHSCPKKYV